MTTTVCCNNHFDPSSLSSVAASTDAIEACLRSMSNPTLTRVFDSSLHGVTSTYPLFRQHVHDTSSASQWAELIKLWNLASQHNNEAFRVLYKRFVDYDRLGYFSATSSASIHPSSTTQPFSVLLVMSPELKEWYYSQNIYVREQVRRSWICGCVEPRIRAFVDQLDQLSRATTMGHSPLELLWEDSDDDHDERQVSDNIIINPLMDFIGDE